MTHVMMNPNLFPRSVCFPQFLDLMSPPKSKAGCGVMEVSLQLQLQFGWTVWAAEGSGGKWCRIGWARYPFLRGKKIVNDTHAHVTRLQGVGTGVRGVPTHYPRHGGTISIMSLRLRLSEPRNTSHSIPKCEWMSRNEGRLLRRGGRRSSSTK